MSALRICTPHCSLPNRHYHYCTWFWAPKNHRKKLEIWFGRRFPRWLMAVIASYLHLSPRLPSDEPAIRLFKIHRPTLFGGLGEKIARRYLQPPKSQPFVGLRSAPWALATPHLEPNNLVPGHDGDPCLGSLAQRRTSAMHCRCACRAIREGADAMTRGYSGRPNAFCCFWSIKSNCIVI